MPPELLQPAVDAIIHFLEIDLDNPSTWYQKDLGSNGIVPLHHHQALWNIRQHPPVFELFAQLLNTKDLRVRLDRASFKPPWRPEYPEQKDDSPFHTDSHPENVYLPRFQGILYLTDTEEDQGAFYCTPSLYHGGKTATIKKSLLFTDDELMGHPIVHAGGKAGSFVLWDSRLPHGSSLNYNSRPRFAQYISMFPAGTEGNKEDLITLWREKIAPKGWRKLPYQQDPEPGNPAVLTELGKQLIGL